MNRIASLLSGIALGAALGCGGSSDEQEAVGVLHRQTDAVQREDMQAYMSTMDPKAKDLDAARDSTQELFDKYKLIMWVESAEVVSIKGDKAEIRASIVTKKVEGDAFRNNKTTAIHSMRKVDGQWRLVGSRPENVEFLP